MVKNRVVAFFSALLLSFCIHLSNVSASYENGAPAISGTSLCSLEFEASGHSIHVGIGSAEMSGHGEIRCLEISGKKHSVPVSVELKGVGFGIGFSQGTMHLVSADIGWNGGIRDLLGKYRGVKANVEVVGGIGVGFTLHHERHGLDINAGLTGSTVGLGLQLDAIVIELTEKSAS